ncbi:MAG: DNA (cytosine-5-)-methyltransferase [Planctomycetaceae bacterium]|jgi:DNA (cytosine-5)-methyltransferase 1|nr:DNA (cytosine-5-)-methyltransferase [Planctomycetaceae bacterium]
MLHFAESKIIPFWEPDKIFSRSVAESFSLQSVNVEWAGYKPNKQEDVLVRLVSPDGQLFRSFGGQCVFSSEWDNLAKDTYQANFGECPAGDITTIDAEDIPNHDILLAGFPCQPFSIIGKREGFTDTRGTLFFEIERILYVKRPTAFLLENVKQFRTHDNGNTCKIVLEKLQELGYYTYITVLNALNFGVAQKRERTFIVGFNEPLKFQFPKTYGWRPNLKDVLENDATVNPKLFASDMICKKRLERLKQQGQNPFYPSMWHENKGGHIGIHPFSCALRHNAFYNYLLVNGNRRPTGREMLRFQGFPESYKIVVDHSAIRSQAGNSVAVPVITAIAAEMMIALRNKTVMKPVVKKSEQRLFELEEELIMFNKN